jgi:hypothetical protein
MIYLVLNRSAWLELMTAGREEPSPLWVNAGVLTPEELAELRQSGARVTNFSSFIDPESEPALQEALEIIREHHPEVPINILR